MCGGLRSLIVAVLLIRSQSAMAEIEPRASAGLGVLAAWGHQVHTDGDSRTTVVMDVDISATWWGMANGALIAFGAQFEPVALLADGKDNDDAQTLSLGWAYRDAPSGASARIGATLSSIDVHRFSAAHLGAEGEVGKQWQRDHVRVGVGIRLRGGFNPDAEEYWGSHLALTAFVSAAY